MPEELLEEHARRNERHLVALVITAFVTIGAGLALCYLSVILHLVNGC